MMTIDEIGCWFCGSDEHNTPAHYLSAKQGTQIQLVRAGMDRVEQLTGFRPSLEAFMLRCGIAKKAVRV